MLFERRAWIVHDGRSGLSLSRNDQYRDRHSNSGLGGPLRREEEVVVARRDLAQQVVVLAAREVTGVVSVLLGVEVADRFARRDPRQAAVREQVVPGSFACVGSGNVNAPVARCPTRKNRSRICGTP